MSDPTPQTSSPMATPSTWALIKWPALVTLVVTIVRLVGELEGWSPKYFNSDSGGPGAIIGIVWLAPLFGIWYARRLAHAGERPVSRGRAILWPLVALLLMVGASAGIIAKLPEQGVPFIVSIQASFLVCAAIAWRGWPKLARVNFSYGLLARIPVALVMLIALYANWGTHYEKGVKNLPELPLLQKWLLIGVLPQLDGWICFTIIAGGLTGGLSLLLGPKEAAASVEASTPAPQAP
jgi:hypothetical protein